VGLRIGIDLGGTKIEGIALNGGDEAARARVDTPRGDYDATLAAVAGVVHALERQAGGAASLIPVGLGIPGTISRSNGLVKNANSTWLIGHPLRDDLEARLERPVRVANDANCFAASEAGDGAAAGARVVFGVIVGTGVGAGIVVNGQVLDGANGIGGEWGHNPLPWPDEDDGDSSQCYCGKHGCIETFLAGPAFAADHERVAGARLLPSEIVAAAARGDAAADASMRRYERRMARALASVINVLDPDVIVLGGGMSNIDRLYAHVPPLWSPFVFAAEARATDGERTAPRMANAGSPLSTRLLPARHGAASGVRGAAWLWPP
jgi:fructokinase